MELLKYLLIILPLLVTLIPVVLKTTKEDRGVRHFLNLTTSGVWLVAVIAMLTAVSIIYEYFDNENIDNEKAALRQRAKDDSTVAKLRYDSTQLDLKSANDSITNLGKINSTLLNNDTVNFATTLDNFRQQLNGQGKTLKELNNLINADKELHGLDCVLILDSMLKKKNREADKLVASYGECHDVIMTLSDQNSKMQEILESLVSGRNSETWRNIVRIKGKARSLLDEIKRSKAKTNPATECDSKGESNG